MKFIPIVTAGLTLSACTTLANPPSLLPRAIETRSDAVTTPPSAPLAKPLEPTLAAGLAALVREAMAGDRDFIAAAQTADSTIAAGRNTAQGSERWIAAELARSARVAAHQRSAAPLAEIDALTVARADLMANDASVGGLAEYQAAQQQVEAIVARQSAKLEALSR